MREITAEQADAAYTILVHHAGAYDHPRARDGFVYHVTDGCMEYRFQGLLGFGGKFRNNGNHENVPHVDCYSEDLNVKRNAVILATNAMLAELFVNC